MVCRAVACAAAQQARALLGTGGGACRWAAGAAGLDELPAQQASRRAVSVAACSPQSCSPCENRGVTPDGHTCPIDFEAAETVDYKSSLSKAP